MAALTKVEENIVDSLSYWRTKIRKYTYNI